MMMLVGLVLSLMVGGMSPQTPDPAWDSFERAVQGEDGAGAVREAERLIRREPSDAHARYALVRAHMLADDLESAQDAMREALANGFVDFHRLYHDPTMTPLLSTDLGRWIEQHWRERLDTRSRIEADALARALGERYEVIVDEAHRVRFVSALDEELVGFAREEIDRVARFASELFSEDSEDRPDPWVMIVLPTPEDADRLLPQADASGVYDHGRKGLVVRDIGPSLRHEWFHALHWRHMERTGRFHPIWVREGLATLVEDVDVGGEELVVLPSWRTNIARRLAEVRRLRPWEDFVELSPKRFVTTRPVSNYAQARALMHWLHERGVLGGWFQAYDEVSDTRPNDLGCVARATGVDPDAWAHDLRAWLLEQPEVGVPGRRNPIGLGLRLRPGDGDGPVVDQTGVTSDDGVRLRLRDVIRAVDGVPVRTLSELYRELGTRRAGDRVRVTLDRAGRIVEAVVELVREEDLLGLG